MYNILLSTTTFWVIPYYSLFFPMRKLRHSEFKPLAKLNTLFRLKSIWLHRKHSFLYGILQRTTVFTLCEWRASLNWLRHISEKSNSNNNNCIYYLLITHVVQSTQLAFFFFYKNDSFNSKNNSEILVSSFLFSVMGQWFSSLCNLPKSYK